MTKTEAANLFDGNKAALGRACGVSRSAVCQWPEELPSDIRDRVLAAALREGRITPRQHFAMVKDAA